MFRGSGPYSVCRSTLRHWRKEWSIKLSALLIKTYLDTDTGIHSDDEDTIEMSDDVSFSDENTGIIFQKEKSKKVTDYQRYYQVNTRNYVCG